MKRKIINTVILLAVGYGIFLFVKFVYKQKKENPYSGKVVKCYITPAGYKVASEKHVVFYNDSLKRNIDVKVTNQTYANTAEGRWICFYLNRMQLEE